MVVGADGGLEGVDFLLVMRLLCALGLVGEGEFRKLNVGMVVWFSYRRERRSTYSVKRVALIFNEPLQVVVVLLVVRFRRFSHAWFM